MLDEVLPLQLITAKLAKSIARLETEINSSTKHVCNDPLHVNQGVRNASVALAQW